MRHLNYPVHLHAHQACDVASQQPGDLGKTALQELARDLATLLKVQTSDCNYYSVILPTT